MYIYVVVSINSSSGNSSTACCMGIDLFGFSATTHSTDSYSEKGTERQAGGRLGGYTAAGAYIYIVHGGG